jgi:activator of 2-hydroxyglutaryl-CoA dehydratase
VQCGVDFPDRERAIKEAQPSLRRSFHSSVAGTYILKSCHNSSYVVVNFSLLHFSARSRAQLTEELFRSDADSLLPFQTAIAYRVYGAMYIPNSVPGVR